MKVISGKYRGKILKTLAGDTTRPTTSRIKESIFNIVQFHISEARVLDLFAGSGQMGIECLSRGASFCDFNDAHKQAVQIIKQNIQGVDPHFNISNVDYKSFLTGCKQPYDLIFLDPPYHKNMINDVLILIKDFQLLKNNGIIICETHISDQINFENTGFRAEKIYKYGTIQVIKVV